MAFVSRAPDNGRSLLADFARFYSSLVMVTLLVCTGVTEPETLELKSLVPFLVFAFKEIFSPSRNLKPASRVKPGVTPWFGN